jgi:hypothetical protein
MGIFYVYYFTDEVNPDGSYKHYKIKDAGKQMFQLITDPQYLL